jgi:hypothetical protein
LKVLLFNNAVVFHPRLKVGYLRKARWQTPWIEEAIAMARAEYNKCYAGDEFTDNISNTQSETVSRLSAQSQPLTNPF